jgi:hypothetical protein
MAIEILGWHYDSTILRPEAPMFLEVTDGQKEYLVPIPGVYVPGDGVREEVLTALAAIEDLGKMLQTYADRVRKQLIQD